ncbi:PREDICTED: calcium-binding protein 8-like [Thamnophis sirtalis]|uniref:Calcium-binding protein 8-like n=1 Tax=Thamnophis sirtalis TaxID=35019 RepID=A0A6I9XH48_9SAUR|nr:PREDICTED: calcium-binding protein 8-like [Thamnophis sirtalis]
MAMASFPSRSWEWPCALWDTCLARWNWPLLCSGWTWMFDMQRITLEELKHILYHAFQDHLTMKDIENIIITEEESLNENSGNCQTEFEVHSQKQNRQTCVRKSLICAFAMAFIISVMLIAANQILRSGME